MLAIKLTEPKEFNVIYADMLKQFPEKELKSYNYFINLIKTCNYCAYKIFNSDKNIGYILLYKNRAQNKLWLDYFAVYEEFHSLGYGSKILNLLKEKFNTYEGIYLEVEKLDKNNKNTYRRIQFYKNNGAKLCPVNYIYPTKTGGFPMDLYFLPFHKTPPCKNDILADIQKTFQILHKDTPHLEKVIELIN